LHASKTTDLISFKTKKLGAAFTAKNIPLIASDFLPSGLFIEKFSRLITAASFQKNTFSSKKDFSPLKIQKKIISLSISLKDSQ